MKRRPRYGSKNKPGYTSWQCMNARCSNPKNQRWDRYGGRGIRVCPAWRKDFLIFYADMGPRPSPHHTLDRKDNDGNYEPGNCRWATRAEQQNNKRSNRILTCRGISMTLTQWAKTLDLNVDALRSRLANNWPIEEALYYPQIPPGKKYRSRGFNMLEVA